MMDALRALVWHRDVQCSQHDLACAIERSSN